MSVSQGNEWLEIGPGEGTRLESVEEIRKAIQPPPRTPTVKEAAHSPDAVPFRPLYRPPMAVLCILDDGREDGEWVRLRGDRIVIGRTDGDVLVPHDDMISSRHAELVRSAEKGRYRWFLNDLQSTNGVFVRVGEALLRHRQELLLGGRRYRFDSATQGAARLALPPDPGTPEPKGTSGWQSVAPTDLFPSLVEVKPQAEGTRTLLTKSDVWIGRDPNLCPAAFSDDLLLSPRHARIYRDPKGHWRLENAASRNGCWVRVHRVALENTAQFQLGEQRFLIRILG